MSTRTLGAPTTNQMSSNSLSKMAQTHWSEPPGINDSFNFDINVVDKIFDSELKKNKFDQKTLLILEFSRYLENYLWPGINDENCTTKATISIACMINIKMHQAVPAWEAIKNKPKHFPTLFKKVLELMLDETLPVNQQTILLKFLGYCYRSLEVTAVHFEVKKTLNLDFLTNISEGRLKELFSQAENIELKKKYKKLKKKNKLTESIYNTAIPKLVNKFLVLIVKEEFDRDLLDYCQRFVDWMIDLDSSLFCRRFFNTYLLDSSVVVRCKNSNLYNDDDVFTQLVNTLEVYCAFEIDDISGSPLSKNEMLKRHYTRMKQFQKCIYENFEKLKPLSLSSIAKINTKESLTKCLFSIEIEELKALSGLLNLRVLQTDSKKVIIEMIVSYYVQRKSQLDEINNLPLYPTEGLLWSDNLTKTENFIKDECLALPKLNLQFLTLHDYLLRNFKLFHLESAFEIRHDIEKVVSSMKPWLKPDNTAGFFGWSRMGLPLQSFSIVEVTKPNIGEFAPAQVRADLKIVTNSLKFNVRQEWENLRKHDVCFLVTILKSKAVEKGKKEPFQDRYKLLVRGCEVEGMLDDDGRVIEEGPEEKPVIKSNYITYRVYLDTNQYQNDMESIHKQGNTDPYESFHLVIRRKPKENNFKAVLKTIRDLMNTKCVVPEWLHKILLGFGNPSSANYKTLHREINNLDWNDTFISYDHLCSSFPNYTIKLEDENQVMEPPFKLNFSRDDTQISVTSHEVPNRGPYLSSSVKRNSIRFTPTQIEAIRSGLQPGLTMVVGPPGTGKTDVAVQIISNLYHNFPEQRTLIVTHSNQALNQLFEKIMELDIDERHLLRLGHGEEELETKKDFSRYGRVNFILRERKKLLTEVGLLQSSLGIPGEVSYTCETACHFFLYQVLSRWEKYEHQMNKSKSVDDLKILFPFNNFFKSAQPLFTKNSFEENWKIAEGCFCYIRTIFTKLEEFRAFELMQSGLDRSKYLLIKSAKIIAMTCTHAALRRQDLVQLDFKYDNILMEESAQILEIETFIPLLLQNPCDGYNRLKRWIMIGDHHQLPPVVQNLAFQKFSNMEQSLFTRFVRLGVPTVQLDAQGRCRKDLCDLFRWRYPVLNELSHVESKKEYKTPNPGFKFNYQLLNVADCEESEPTPYFYQNINEAEYCVAIFQYMRLIGYPKDKITILTTYNGQKQLIRDVLRKKCENHPLLGLPHKVTTVDKYQGQQNDYIILSLVRTKTVGHLRDVRRLVVALSRARLGLYIVAKKSLFSNCYELSQSFDLLNKNPEKLHLFPNEAHSECSDVKGGRGRELVINNMQHLCGFVYNKFIDKMRQMQQQQNVNAFKRPLLDMPEVDPPKNPHVENKMGSSEKAE